MGLCEYINTLIQSSTVLMRPNWSWYYIGIVTGATERKLHFKVTTATSCLALMGEVLFVYYEHFEEHWPCYNGTVLYQGWLHDAHTIMVMGQSCGFPMMTSSNGNIFRVAGPLSGFRWIPHTKASDAELWCFLWSWINRWVNNCEAGDLKRHLAHYDVIVMHWLDTQPIQITTEWAWFAIRPFGTNFKESRIEVKRFFFMKAPLYMSCVKYRIFVSTSV